MAAAKTFSREEVAKNNNEDSLWIVIDSKVYDLTDFAAAHPGGEHVLKQVAGKDATQDFYQMHRHEVLTKYADLVIGTIQGEKSKIITRQAGELEVVPYAEPAWLRKPFKNPYYTESHFRLQKEVRKFVDEVVKPEALRIEDSGEKPSQEFWDKLYSSGLGPMRLGPGKHLQGRKLFADIKPEEFNYFHELVIAQEFSLTRGRACDDAFGGGTIIGLPPVLNFCKNQELREKVINDVFSGKTRIALAITEAFAGSDVAGLRTTAVKTADGKHYIVNGTKKWITNGTFSNWFTVGVATKKGLSVLLVPRGEGVETTQIKTSYSSAAGTAFITFDNVKVPVENLLGEEDKGIQVILSNFNHERWVMCAGITRAQRNVIKECMQWANQRVVFGKPLISQPVIRQKIARMLSLNEACQNWLEHITYQMCHMSYQQQSVHLAGPIGLLKNFITRASTEIADESVQIFGGRGITKNGMGSLIESFNRCYKFDSILGGSEEILADLAVRQAYRKFPNSML